MHDAKLSTARSQHHPVAQLVVGDVVGVDDRPQHLIGGMEVDRCVGDIAQRHRSIDVVVVAVGQHDRPHAATMNGVDDRLVVVSGVDHEHLAFVADQPDVVGDFPLAAVQREHTLCRHQLDHDDRIVREALPPA